MQSWSIAVADRQAPLAAIDLDAFDANAADLVRRAGGLPIRVASKSVRCRAMIERALMTPGFVGVMAYHVREALWLVAEGIDDVYVAYPSVDREAIRQLAGDDHARARVTLTIDSPEHVEWLVSLGAKGVRVALDVDASLRVGPVHIGARRSPLRSADDAAQLARTASRAGLQVVGVMFYDAQIAGVPDSSPAIRVMKARSDASLRARRGEIVTRVRDVADLEFVNGGGTGSLHITGKDPAITELAAGSGLYAPTLFDGYDAFQPRPAAAFALPVVRRPAPGYVTVFQGGYIASGPPGWDRVPTPVWPPGLELVKTEGAGEVQTPLHGDAADGMAIGDLVWFRHGKAGELAERFDAFHLIRAGERVDTVPTYRGENFNYG
ncbi:amino acid deaminase/aldolase [Janibacter sp. GXQ6167]|uniref:amino acid deaminase/aldolase n=1 Tax=Janibacter sp. GXQ6167 TaxID=3240791 RepID=UPI0035257881